MFTLSITWQVPGRRHAELGPYTFVRAYPFVVNIQMLNDGQSAISDTELTMTLQYYAGQDRTIVSSKHHPVDAISPIKPGGARVAKLSATPFVPGLVSLKFQLADKTGAPILVRRSSTDSYSPDVTWWFYTMDDITLEIKDALKLIQASLEKLSTQGETP